MGFMNELVHDSLKKQSYGLKSEMIYFDEFTFLDECYDIIVDNNIKNRVLMNEVYNRDINTESEIKFQDIIKNSINDFLANSISLLDRFTNSVFGDVRLNLKCKKINEYNGTVCCPQLKYDYKKLFSDKLYSTFEREINATINSLVKDIKEVEGYRNDQNLVASMKERILVDNREEIINMIRAKILKSQEPITEQMFGSALYNYFRSTNEKYDNCTIDDNVSTSRIREASREYYSAYVKQKDIIKQYNELIAYTKSINIDSRIEKIDFSKFGEESKILIKAITMNACFRIESLCNIYLLYLASNFDAIIEYNKINRDICLSVLKKLEDEDNE